MYTVYTSSQTMEAFYRRLASKNIELASTPLGLKRNTLRDLSHNSFKGVIFSHHKIYSIFLYSKEEGSIDYK